MSIGENLGRVEHPLFGADYMPNVQPHSGTQANMAVYFTFLRPGEVIVLGNEITVVRLT